MLHLPMYRNGALPEPFDYTADRLAGAHRNLPEHTVSHRDDVPRRDQGPESTCVGFSSAFCKQWWDAKQGRPYTLYSPRDLYAECKRIDGHPTVEGTYTSTAMQVLQKRGIALEEQWPYVPYGDNTPRGDLVEEALAQRISKFAAIRNADDLIQVLMFHGPAVACVPVTNGWYTPEAQQTGLIDAAYDDDQGGHAVEIIGFDAERQLFEAGGSWGPTFGDHGHHWFPRDWFAHHAWGMWTIYDDTEIDDNLEIVKPL
jgi:hypothetical protein